MNDKTKTIAFLGAAGVARALALLTGPGNLQETDQESKKGTLLFEFSATTVAGIEIVEREKGKRESIDVSKEENGW